MAHCTRWSLPRDFCLAAFLLLLTHCRADDLKERRLFGISVQAVPEEPQQQDMGAVVEAPSRSSVGLPSLPDASPSTNEARQTVAPLPGFAIDHTGLEGVKREKKQYDAAQWLLLLQFLVVFWLIIVLMVTFIFLLEKYGILKKLGDGQGQWGQQNVYMGMSKAFVLAASIVLGLGVLFTIFAVYEGYYTTPPEWFNKYEKAEAAFIKNLPVSIPGLSPTPAPTPSPAVIARAKAEKEARDAQAEYQAVKNQLEQLQVQLKQQKEATEQQRHAFELAKTAAQQKAAELAKEQAKNQALSHTPPPTAPPTIAPAPTFAPNQMSSLAAKVAALKKKAEAKAAQAKSVTVPPPPVAAAPAAPLPPGASPCTTLAPQLAAAPTTPLPQIQNFIPPAPCECKAIGAWKDHCAEYPGQWATTPACVVADKTCSPETNAPTAPDGNTGNVNDKVVKCIAAPEGGGTPYSVTLDTSMSNSALGMKILPDKKMTDLIVTSVEGGVVEQFNEAHPGNVVKVGDMITAVNGIMGNSVALLKESIKKEKLTLSMMHQVGYPIAEGSTALPAASKCPADVHPWGVNSVCLRATSGASTGAGPFMWHCPWESMMAVSSSTVTCSGVEYDCDGTNYHAVLDLYKAHDKVATPPPEGSLETVDYVKCCIRHQCMAQPLAACGKAPWIPGKSVSPFVGKTNPCGAAGCERLFSINKVLPVLRSRAAVAVAGLGLLLLAAAVLAITRSRGLRGDHAVLLETDAEEARTDEAFVNVE